MESAIVECCCCLIEEQGKYSKSATIYLRKPKYWTEKNHCWKWSKDSNTQLVKLLIQKLLKFYIYFIIQGGEWQWLVYITEDYWQVMQGERKCGISNDLFSGESQASLNIHRIFHDPTFATGKAIHLQGWRCTEAAFICRCSLFLFGKMKMLPVYSAHWSLWQWKYTLLCRMLSTALLWDGNKLCEMDADANN